MILTLGTLWWYNNQMFYLTEFPMKQIFTPH